jgi:phosphoadenosine phosphosulfate reductase
MISALNQALVGHDLPSRIRTLREAIPGKLVFTTSFGLEDQALTHAIVESGADIAFATLDTGRLFPETYALWSKTEERYGLRITAYAPRHEVLEGYIAETGVNGFYHSIEARKACCHVRKVEPLGRALKGASGWITGLRADQSTARGGARFAENNADYQLVKLNPLADWSREAVLAYAEAQGVPISPLHEQGFLSIGCAPCTRAIAAGEPERAGRWWWEDEAKKECGLHVGPDGRLMPYTSQSEARP